MAFSGDSTTAASKGAAEKSATDKAFTAYDIQECLYDEKRVGYLHRAIEKIVKKGDVVVDAGSGTGLLGMLAARAGAERVYCLELNPDFIEVIEQNARNNDLDEQIIAISADATTYDLPEPVDVLISEVISAGFFYEPQLQIVQNLIRFLKPGGRVIPMAMRNYVELIDAQQELYGLNFSFDSRWRELRHDRSLTTAAPYLETDFRTPDKPEINATVRVDATHTGTANAVKVSYKIDFAPGVSADKATEFLLNPQILFLRHPQEVKKGEGYDVSLTYLASDSPLNCKIGITPAS